MNAIFEQTQKTMNDELMFWSGRLTQVTEQAVDGSEKLLESWRENVEQTLETHSRFVVEAMRHGAGLIEQQTQAFNEVLNTATQTAASAAQTAASATKTAKGKK